MKKNVLFGVIILLIAYQVCPAVVGRDSFEFMLIGAGSRASAMGEAFTAVSGDAGAPFFNPALAGVMKTNEVSFAHIAYMKDVTVEQFAFLSQAGKLRFGGMLNLGKVANIERRDTTPSGEPLGYFDEHDVTAGLFWGLPLTEKLSIGNSIKYAYEKLDLDAASALAIDLGGFFNLTNEIALGASLRNLGTRPKFIDKSYDLPREIRIGASYRMSGNLPNMIFSADYVKPEWGDRSSKFDIGGEYNYQNLAYLRAGGYFGYDSRSIALGAGMSYRNYYFDYSFVPLKNNLGNTHRFTLRIRL